MQYDGGAETFADFAPAFAGGAGAGGYNLGLDLSLPTADYSAMSNLTLPTMPDIQPASFGERALDVMGKVGTGLEKGFEDSPLKSLSQVLGLGAGGFNIASQLKTASGLNRQTQAIERAQKQATTAAAPAVEFGKESLDAARAGKLPAPMEAAVEQWKQQAKADMRARLASMGLGNSTDIQSEEARIDLMGEAMKAQLLQGQEGVALQGINTGVSAATGAGQMGAQQQQQLLQLIAGANEQLAKLGATA